MRLRGTQTGSRWDISKYKASLVANGRSQQIGIDCHEAFSPAVKPTTIWTILSLAISRNWLVHQFEHLNHAYLLKKSLYGLKQAPRAWFQREPHLSALKRILCYVKGPLDHGIQLYAFTKYSHTSYLNVDWAGCPNTRRSTLGYCVFLGDNLLLWSSKWQNTLSQSSAEVEYRGVANAMAQISWLYNLLCELHAPLFTGTHVYSDNVSVIYMSSNPMKHQ
nr:ribonuclease H-like domain-containing protein [Tanacetum cinerariifolium]